MALSTTEQLDYLWKKIGYGVTKTDSASNKLAFNESIASPLLLRADKLWTQAGEIPGVKPTTTSSVVRIYKDGSGSWTSTVRCVEDTTSSDNRTWKTNSTDWIPPEFGSTYLVTVYIDSNTSTTPQSTGTQLFAAGASGSSNDEWFFDYQSGVLYFIGTNLPTDIASGVTGKSIYISGARYIGTFGISGSVSSTSADLGNIHIEQNTISSSNTNGNIILDPNGTGVTNIIGNLNVSATSNLGPTSNVVITGGTIGQFLQTDGYGSLTWATVDSFKIANGTSEVYTYLNGNVGISAGGTSNVVVVTSTGATLSGTLTAGNLTATNDVVIGGNLTVSGTTQYINVTSTVIKDPIIELGGEANAGPLITNDTKDRGTLLHYYTTKTVDAFMGWDNSASEFAFGSNVSVTDNIITFNELGNIRAGNANLGDIASANYFVGNGTYLTGLDTVSVGVSTVALKLANGTSNVNIPVQNGNITFGVSGNSNVVVVTGTGINVAGTLNTGIYTANFGNAGITNTLLVGNIVTGSGSGGNISGADYITANILQGVLTSGTSNVNIRSSGGNVTLSVGGTANVLTATTTGINLLYSTTSIANLGNLVTANYVSVAGNISTSGIKTDNYYYANGSPLDVQQPAGSDSQLQFNDSSDFGASSKLTFNKTTNVFAVTGNITGSNASLGNLVTANYITVSANLTSGNASLGNLASANYVTVNSNLIAGNANITSTLKSKDIDVTGNATIAGNLTVNGNFTYVQSTVTYVTDPIVEQGGGTGAAALITNDTKDRGVVLHYYTTKAVDAFMGWDNSNGEFALGSNVSVTDNIVTFNTFGNIRVGNAVLGNLATVNHVTVSANLTSGNANLGNLATANYVTISSNLTSGNANLGNLASANYVTVLANLTSGNARLGNLASANYVTVSANLTSGNANLGNAVSANYFLGDGSLLTGVAASSATTIQITEQFSGTYYPILANSYNNNTYALGSNASISFDITQGALTVTSLNGIINTAEQTNITKVGNLQSLQVGNASSDGTVKLFDDGSAIATGNITANYYFGNGALLTGILDASQSIVSLQSNVNEATSGQYYVNFTNDVTGSLQIQANSNLRYSVSLDTLSAGLLQGTLTTGSQPSVTSLGTLSQLNVSGNSNVDVINASGNITAPYYFGNGSLLTGVAIASTANISFEQTVTQANTGLYYLHFGNATAGTQGIAANDNLVFDATRGELITTLLTGTLTTAYQNNITSLGQLIGLDVAGNATISGTLTVGSLAGTLTTASQPAITQIGTLGNLNVSGNIVTGNLLADNIYGPIRTASQPYITSLGTLTSLTVSGNITAGNIDGGNLVTSNYFAGSGLLLSDINGANVYGSVSSANRAGTVTTNAQPNITSVGTLSSLRVTGNANVGSISTDSINYANGDPYIFNVSANGSTGYVQFNDNNQFTGNSYFTYDIATKTLAVPNISATTSNTVALNVSGNANFASLSAVKITGGLPDYVIKTDGSGNLSWVQVDTNQAFTGASYVSIARDLFTVADATTSQITLSMTPVSKSAIQVNIDGIIQLSDSYNLTNNLLDFDEYLEEGSKVEVTMYGVIDVSGGDNQIQYSVSGAFDSSANLTFDPATNTLTANKVNVTDGPLTISGSTISVTTGVSAGIFNLGTPNITMGSTSSNVIIGSSSGNIVLKGTVLATEFASNRAAVAISSATQIDSFSTTKYRTAKYVVSAKSDVGYQSLEVLLIHDGGNSYITTYGAIGTVTDDDIVILSSNVVSGYVCLYATDIYPNTSVNLLSTYVNI